MWRNRPRLCERSEAIQQRHANGCRAALGRFAALAMMDRGREARPQKLSRLRGRQLRRLRAQAEQVADRVDQIRPVHRVEVKVVHPLVHEVEHLLGRHGAGHEPAGLDVVLRAPRTGRPASRAPRRRCAARITTCLKFCTGRMPGMIRMVVPGSQDLAGWRRWIGLEELGDGLVGASIRPSPQA